MKKGAWFLLLMSVFLFYGNAFSEDATPPTLLDLIMKWEPEALTIFWRTDEPVLYRDHYRYDPEDPWWDGNWSIDYKTEGEENPRLSEGFAMEFYFEFKDEAGNLTTTQIYEYSTSRPYLRGYINIDNSALTTASRNVTLNLQAFDPGFQVTQMSFSNDRQNWSVWESYKNIRVWQLPEGEGLKTVYVRFKNSNGLFMNTPASDSIYYTTIPKPSGPSLVQVKGKQLLVQRPLAGGKVTGLLPYKIKGVSWSPASIGNPGGGYLTERKAEFNNWYIQDIALMKEMGINTVRTYLDFGQDMNVFKDILDELHKNDIMVVMAVDDCIGDLTNLERVVSNFKNHPAILAWQIGNEWNLNRYYGEFSQFADALNFTEQAAQRIKQLDHYHPVVSGLGDSEHFLIPRLGETWWNLVIEYFVSKRCPSVDIWGFNIYRSGSFGGLFYEWSQISPKPMFVSEAGTDAYDHRIDNENPQMQAGFDAGLWDEAYFHLSADMPNEPCLGITFFEWNDEWWKYWGSWSHDAGGYNMPYSHPDDVADEEYFGLVDINRTKRQAYFTLGDRYKKQGETVNLNSLLTLKAVSMNESNGASFFKNGQRFYCKGGGGYGGRGINLAIIDPKTGLVEEVHRFDTWLDSSALLYVEDLIAHIPEGKIILAAIGDEGGLRGQEDIFQAFESIGSTMIRNVGYWDSWALITIKGQLVNLAEGYHPYVSGIGKTPTEVEATIPLQLDLDHDNIPDLIDLDRDNDGLTDVQELAKGTDPLDKDTDDDGLQDNVDLAPAVASLPEVVSINPSTGSIQPEQPVTFTATYKDADGWQNTKCAYLLINMSVYGKNCAYLYYNQNDNKLYLRNDESTAWSGGFAPGSNNIIENSYAKLDCSKTTVSGSGKTLTVKWNITFKPSFVGTQTKNTYLKVTDDSNASTGWTQKGTWLVGSNSAPVVGTITPSSGSSPANTPVTFTTTYLDPNGWQDIQYGHFLINTVVNGKNCFWGYYNQNINKIYLRNDTDTAWLGGFAPGSNNIVETSYAKLDCSKTTVSGSGKTLTVKWNVAFKSAFSGTQTKNTYLKVTDDSGAYNGWIQKGTWLVK